MNYYALGIIVGIVAAVIIALVMWKKTPRSDFDERQLALRGKAFQHAFFAVLIFSAVYTLLVMIIGHPLMEDGVSTLLAALFGVMVFAVECVMRDAFFTVSKTPKYYILLIVAVILSNGITGIDKLRDGSMVRDGLLTFSCFNFAGAVLFLVVLVAILLKLFVLKDKETDE